MWVRLVVRVTGPRTGPSSANQRLLAVGVLDFLSPIKTLAPPWVFLLKERVVVLGFGFFAPFSHGFCWSRCLCCITQSFRFSSRVWLRFSFHAGLLLWCGVLCLLVRVPPSLFLFPMLLRGAGACRCFLAQLQNGRRQPKRVRPPVPPGSLWCPSPNKGRRSCWTNSSFGPLMRGWRSWICLISTTSTLMISTWFWNAMGALCIAVAKHMGVLLRLSMRWLAGSQSLRRLLGGALDFGLRGQGMSLQSTTLQCLDQ